MSININNVTKICRTCLTEKPNMRPILEAYVADMLMSCADIKIKECDDLPKIICLQCLHQLNRNFAFKQLCEKSDRALQAYLGESKSYYRLDLKEQQEEQNASTVGVMIYNKSEEYDKQTRQLKLEISEHLRLDISSEILVDYNNQLQIQENDSANEISVKKNVTEASKVEFKCHECDTSFEGKLI